MISEDEDEMEENDANRLALDKAWVKEWLAKFIQPLEGSRIQNKLKKAIGKVEDERSWR